LNFIENTGIAKISLPLKENLPIFFLGLCKWRKTCPVRSGRPEEDGRVSNILAEDKRLEKAFYSKKRLLSTSNIFDPVILIVIRIM